VVDGALVRLGGGLGLGLGGRLLLRLLLGLPLCSLGRAEELRERTFTHAGAPTRH
jgi:hypothetical protein